ncbi:MAG: N-acetylmuramoyl-L-alanine amidase [Betaproteobacteria bacterium]|nr:N-acetylmuramoyl-L-alanine amidase [Betaproteobacteria bacterium]
MNRLPFMRLALGVAALALSGCTTLTIDRSYTARGQDSRAQFLILHYTVIDWPTSLRVLTQQAVSSHYLIRDDPPEIYQLVDENRRAWHAGVSSWKGQTQLNAASIGIEIVNRGFVKNEKGEREWFDYPPAQQDAIIALVKDIVARHQIPPDRVLGHSDIAPQRKQDPGPRFPWKRLAEAGLVLWPDEGRVRDVLPRFEKELPDVEWFQRRLVQHGFELKVNGQYDEATLNVLAAFQMKYRPSNIEGGMDAETAALLAVLTARDGDADNEPG